MKCEPPRCFGKLFTPRSRPCMICEYSSLCSKVEIIYPSPPRQSRSVITQGRPRVSDAVRVVIIGALKEKPQTVKVLRKVVQKKLRKGVSIVSKVLREMKDSGEVEIKKRKRLWLYTLTGRKN